MNATAQDKRMPVTLLTGFLGAGKTTLLNAVLNAPQTDPVAVVVNEFGEAGLDNELITSSSDEIVLMQSGCLCCSIRGDLAQTISDLLIRRAKGELTFERIVIETTGLADPGPILQTMTVDPILSRSTRMDGVVTVCDAANGNATLDAQFEAVAQAAMADLIVLSKTDLALPGEIEALEKRLRSLNSTARIERLVRGEGAAAMIWGITGVHRGVSHAQALGWTLPAEPDPLANLSGLAPKPETVSLSPHDARIDSVSIVLDDPLPRVAFDVWFDTLIAMRGNDILRVKGIVFLQDEDTPYVIHGVQHVFDQPQPLIDWPGGPRQTRIVIIARDITRADLQRSLEILQAKPES